MTDVRFAAGRTKELVKEAERDALALSGSERARRVLRVFSVLAALSVTLVSFVSADPTSEIEKGIRTGTEKIWGIMKAVVLPLGAVAIAVCFLWILFDGERGMEKGKKYMIRVIIVVAIVYLAPLILTEVGGWFAGSSRWFGS